MYVHVSRVVITALITKDTLVQYFYEMGGASPYGLYLYIYGKFLSSYTYLCTYVSQDL